MRSAERLDDRILRSILSTITDVKKRVAGEIASAGSDWNQRRLGDLVGRLNRTGADMARDLSKSMAAHGHDKYTLGAKAVDAILREFSGGTDTIRRGYDLAQLSVLSEYSADLLTKLSAEQIGSVSSALRLGMIGGRSPTDIIRDIGVRLIDEDGEPAPGIWGDTLRRAEVVYRTEGNRVLSIAQQVRMRQHDEEWPGLKKTWLHSLKPPGRARPSHVRAERDYGPGGRPGPIPQGDEFVLHVGIDESSKSFPPGEYPCMFPRDPALPAAASILCGCAVAPWRDGWEDL